MANKVVKVTNVLDIPYEGGWDAVMTVWDPGETILLDAEYAKRLHERSYVTSRRKQALEIEEIAPEKKPKDLEPTETPAPKQPALAGSKKGK